MSAPATLTAYERFIWARLAEVCRAWRDSPIRERALDVEKVGRQALSLRIPFEGSDQRVDQLYAVVLAARDFAGLGLHAKNEKWPMIAAALPIIDAMTAKPEPAPAPEPSSARPAVEGLDAGKLPYWVE